MTLSLDTDRVSRFRTLVASRMGLQFEDAKLGWLGEVLQRRAEARRCTDDAYLAALEADPAGPEIDALAQELTVPETFFFRNIDQFRALQELVLPERLRVQASQRRLRILSAGCASGEEAYSIAMALHGRLPDPAWQVAIHAVDLNPVVIDKARRGRYTHWSLRETPAALQARWFRTVGSELLLDDTVRAAVVFEVRNLQVDDPLFWRPGSFDVVFCRNVLMYFTPARAQAVVARISQSLAPGGVLFLGHAETLRGLSQDFELRHTHGTFYYQRKGEAAAARDHFSAPATTRQSDTAPAADSADRWVDTIDRSAARIRALTEPAASAAPASPSPANTHLADALDLFQQERFAEALGLVQAMPAEAARDPQVRLLLAVLLAHDGQLQQAEADCHRLLADDGLNAGAHYALALCREGAGDQAGATSRYQAAARLDPGFAMPRLHLGLLARRAGQREAARRELIQALALLRREDASRLLLFGGGFDRASLLALCRAELQAVGGTP